MRVPADGLLATFEIGDDHVYAYVTGTGDVLSNVHVGGDCAVEHCVIHNPSDHLMRDFPTHWRDGGPFDVKPPHMERICPHGIGHPDPDSAAFLALRDEDIGVHGCDGCCGELPIQAYADAAAA